MIFLVIMLIKTFFNFIFLFYNYVFNGKVIDPEESLYYNITSTYGLNKKAAKCLESRIELDMNLEIKKLDKQEWETFLETIYFLVPYKCNVLKRLTFNIYMLDVISSYRGWRHYRGLPVRGQRTWSNAWSSYKSNWIMRNFKLLAARNSYGGVPVKDVKVASIAEHVNLTWKNQWEVEWLAARNSRLKFKGNKNTIKIDIYAMSNYQVMHPLKLKNLSKKQKQSFKKNYFSLGFDPGFTKPLLLELYNLANLDENSNPQELLSSSLIMKDARASKRNAPRKKAEINKKVKKKKKKSVWD